MFNGSSNIIIYGGTFILSNAGSASLEELGVNICQNPSVESNHNPGGSNLNFSASHGQGLSTNQFSYGNLFQKANVLESCKPQVDSAPRSHSADNFGTSVYTSGRVLPEYSPNPTPTSITSEVKTCASLKSVGASRRDTKPNDDSHAPSPHSQYLAISQRHNMVRTRSRVVRLVLTLIILGLAHRHRPLATMPTPTSVKSVGAPRRNTNPNDDSHSPPLHSQSLAISQSHNMVGTRSRPSFGNVIQLVLGFSLAHSRRLLATMSGYPQMSSPTSVKSVGASRPNNNTHTSPFHPLYLAISPILNTVRMRRSRSGFGNITQFLSLSLAHSRRLLATMLGHALNHFNTFSPFSDPTIGLWRTLRSDDDLSNLLQPLNLDYETEARKSRFLFTRAGYST